MKRPAIREFVLQKLRLRWSPDQIAGRPAYSTVQIGRAPYDPPNGEPLDLRSAEVEVGDAGTNAPIAR